VNIRLNGFDDLSGPDLPLVSVIMPAFNASSTIAESIKSVLDQTYKNWELLVIDDGSKDNTTCIVESIEKNEKRIVLLRISKNAGLPNARNEGWRIAKGDFIAFLDSDDLWHKNKLEKQIKFHRKNPLIEISHTNFQSFKDGKVLHRPFGNLIDLEKHKRGYLYPRICYKNPIGILTVMMKASLLRKVNGFDKSLWTFEDQDLWIRIAMMNKEFGYINEPLALYRITETGMVRNLGKYKKAYKTFLNKTFNYPNLNPNNAWRFYNRYFGTVYFKRSQMKLARLYFWKSITFIPLDYIAFSTLLYMLYAEVKNILNMSLK
jgi:teichuronic acid biosynthesis glycosyltransferase TuaG